MLPVVVMLAEILPLLTRVSNVELQSAVANLAAIEVVTVFAKNWSSPIAAANSFNVFNVAGALSTTSSNLLLIIVLTSTPLTVIVLATRLGAVTVSLVIVNVPDGGRIIKIFAHNKATTTGTAAITFEIDGVACDSAAISHVASGSAGKKYSVEPSATNDVLEGSVIEAITNGGSTNASKMEITYVIRR